jgi:hypothetical protein
MCERSSDKKLRPRTAQVPSERTPLNLIGKQQHRSLFMKKIPLPVISIVLVTLAVWGGIAIAAQDRYTVKVPDGLAFSEFKGYETWQDVAVSQTETSLKVIAANTPMINAYRQGVPGNHKLFPEGSKIVKIEWSTKKNTVSPYFVMVPDTLKTVSFIEKDSKRFPDTPPTDGHTPSLLMMQRPTRLSLPPFPQAAPHAGTLAIRP